MVGSVAGSAERSAFWLTRRRGGGGVPRKCSYPGGEVNADVVEIDSGLKYLWLVCVVNM